MNETKIGVYDLKKIFSKKRQPSYRKLLHDLSKRIQHAEYIKTVEEALYRRVIFAETEGNQTNQFEVIYRYISREKMENLLSQHGVIDLSGCYVDDLVIQKRISSITANMLFVFGKTDFQSLIITRDFSFLGAFFHDTAHFANIELYKDGFFNLASFKQSVRFSNVKCHNNLNLSDAYVSEGEFIRCQVTNSALFVATQFTSHATFQYNEIGKNTDYSAADFLCEVSFIKNKFGVQGCFSQSHFSQSAEFSSVSSISELQFDAAIFESSVSFSSIVFKNGIFFEATRANTIRFCHCDFKKDCSLKFLQIDHLFFEYCSFHCNLVFLVNKVFSPTALLFYKVSNYGGIYLDWKTNQVYESIKRGIEKYIECDAIDEPSATLEVEQFTLLERNYRLLSQPVNEDYALVARKRAEVKNMSFPKKLIHKAMDYSSEYGTNPGRCLVFSFFIIALFSVVYFLLGKWSSTAFCQELSIGDCLCYSAAAFITTSYKNISALSHLCNCITILEGFLGVFTAAYFTTIVARKILR